MSPTVNSPPTNARDDHVQPPKLELSPTQLAGGALASVTSAVAASRFGVTGTVVGAAFGSVVSGVAAALYSTSLQHASYRIKTTKTLVLKSPPPLRGQVETAVDASDPTALPPELSGRAVRLPGENDSTTIGPRRASLSSQAAQRPRRSFWKPLVLITVFAFAISVGALAVFETAIGHPISNSKGTGTSIGSAWHQVTGGSTSDRTVSPRSTRTDQSASPAATVSDAGSPSPSATDSPSAGPSGSASAPATNAPTPSDVTSPTPSDTAPAGQAGSPTAGGAPAGAGSPGPTG